MPDPVKKGNTSIRLSGTSPKWHFETQRTTVELVYEGMFAELLANPPKIGGTINGYGNGLLVEDVVIQRLPSGKGTMVVMLEVEVDPPDAVIPDAQPVYEIEWFVVERPIEQAEWCRDLFPDPSGEPQFTNDQQKALNDFNTWESADPTTKQTAYNALSDDFKKLAQKKMRGETTIQLFAPTAMITTIARNVTSAGACGKVYDTVPGFPAGVLPDGFQWLEVGDRSTRSGKHGKWQRQRQFTGAKVWDKDSYPPASGG